MAITRKPKAGTAAVDVDALIRKGGTPAAGEAPVKTEGPAKVILRIPAEMLERVDGAVEARPVRIPRHTWILEAIAEKLEREQRA